MNPIRSMPFLAFLAGGVLALEGLRAAPAEGDVHGVDPYTLAGERSFADGYPSWPAHDTLNVVVEVPAGTRSDWGVDVRDGALRQRFQDGAPLDVGPLAAPADVGSVPGTRTGGTRQLRVIVLGDGAARGQVLEVRPVGLLEGEHEHVVAVRPGGPFADVRDLQELRASFPGVLETLGSWVAACEQGAPPATAGREAARRAVEAARRPRDPRERSGLASR